LFRIRTTRAAAVTGVASALTFVFFFGPSWIACVAPGACGWAARAAQAGPWLLARTRQLGRAGGATSSAAVGAASRRAPGATQADPKKDPKKKDEGKS